MGVSSVAEVAVVGGRGKTGHAVAAALGARGVVARPIGRAEMPDPVAALQGCEAMYLMAPNMAEDEPALVTSLLDAARTAGVNRVVYHSVSAPYAPGMPHHVGKAVSEDLVRRSGLNWTILQPCAYVQNFLSGLRADEPAVEAVYDLDQPFGLVDLTDVGEAAAITLLDPSHVGATYELGGPALVSVRDLAAAAERVLGRPVRLAQIAASDWAAGPGASLGERERSWLLGMFDYYDKHGLPCGPLPLRELLGRPAHDLDTTLRAELS
ncbi:nmra family transcriptional regulator [Aeromicrobium phragmitis]|uniref:Nmra family transcriptional regulator n=1 Tax=Aeromicrobium phragmitis TaxID=2478914 RepID=A0A3L8PN63_9ACTN|nr:nmra family transcriptional regulator [Aeromicrobium phragmitis]